MRAFCAKAESLEKKLFRRTRVAVPSTVNLRITAPLEFKRHFDTELLFSFYFKRLLYLLGLGAT